MSRRIEKHWLFILPAFITMIVLIGYPIIQAIFISLRDFSLIRGTNNYVGGQNYWEVIHDPNFWRAVKNTGIYTGVVLFANFVIGFSMALLCWRLSLKFSKVMRGVILLPMLLVPAAAAMLWRLVIYNPPYEIFTKLTGLPNPLVSPVTALWGVILTVVWGWTPWVFMLLLAGLEGLPYEPIEAAQIDGANAWQTIWHIVLPLMKPIIFVTLSIKALDSFRSFDYPWILTQGGPGGSSHILSTYIFEQSFDVLDYGKGASMSILMVMIAFVASIILLHFSRSEGEQ